jgi:hypothetical protein
MAPYIAFGTNKLPCRIRVSGSGFRLSGSRFRVSGFGLLVPGSRFRELGGGVYHLESISPTRSPSTSRGANVRSAVLEVWHIQDSQGQNMASASRQKSSKRCRSDQNFKNCRAFFARQQRVLHPASISPTSSPSASGPPHVRYDCLISAILTVLCMPY